MARIVSERRIIYMKRKLGILTCSNMTQILDCPVGGCLKDMGSRKGAFEAYENTDIELTGTISCNGCPTTTGTDVILPRVEGLLYYGMTHLHLSYCMLVLCPFVKKYTKVIKEKFRNLTVISGTHEAHQTEAEFRNQVEKQLAERRKTLIP
jgi:predicted metal-binding protein